MSLPTSPLGTGPFKVYAKGYVKGTLSGYAGLTVEGVGDSVNQYPTSQLFDTGGADAAGLGADLAIVAVATRHASEAVGINGKGVFYDQSVDNVVIDFCAANN